MLKRILWFSLLLLSLIGIISLSVGFYQALTVAAGPAARTETLVPPESRGETTEPATKQRNALNLVLMGDSIARGAGDETGKGFSTYLPEYLKNQTSEEIVVHNAGIDGLQSDGLLEILKGGTLKPAIVDADLLLLSIGGNDLRRIRRLSDAAKEDAFQATFARYVTTLTSIMKTIRRDNTDALIIFIGLYNPIPQSSSREDGRLLIAWDEGTQKVIEEDAMAIFIPTYDLFKLQTAKYIAPDALHPNAAGYQAIANRIAKSIEGHFNGGRR